MAYKLLAVGLENTIANVMCHIKVIQHIITTTKDANVTGNTSGSVTEKRLSTKSPVLGLIRLVTIAVLNNDLVEGSVDPNNTDVVDSETFSIFEDRRLIIP